VIKGKIFNLTERPAIGHSQNESARHNASAEQRRHTRDRVEAPAIMHIEGSPVAFLVTVLDVSKSGLRVSCSTAASAGKKVTVNFRGAIVSGEARYCRGISANDFNIGIEAASGSADLVSESGELDVTLMFNRPAR
jgi:PilZ domain-containing protein